MISLDWKKEDGDSFRGFADMGMALNEKGRHMYVDKHAIAHRLCKRKIQKTHIRFVLMIGREDQ